MLPTSIDSLFNQNFTTAAMNAILAYQVEQITFLAFCLHGTRTVLVSKSGLDILSDSGVLECHIMVK